MPSLSRSYIDSLKIYFERQINNFFPSFQGPIELHTESIAIAVEQTTECLRPILAGNKNGFDHLNSGHHATFTYFLSQVYKAQDSSNEIPTKLFLLNKAMNGIDLFYEISMPKHFIIVHTVGMVFAKAEYGDYCVFHQGCTVGRNGDDRPKIEAGTVMYPNSSIIGKCLVRKNTVIAPGVQLINMDTPGNCYVFAGSDGKPTFKEINEIFAHRYFDKSATTL